MICHYFYITPCWSSERPGVTPDLSLLGRLELGEWLPQPTPLPLGRGGGGCCCPCGDKEPRRRRWRASECCGPTTRVVLVGIGRPPPFPSQASLSKTLLLVWSWGQAVSLSLFLGSLVPGIQTEPFWKCPLRLLLLKLGKSDLDFRGGHPHSLLAPSFCCPRPPATGS